VRPSSEANFHLPAAADPVMNNIDDDFYINAAHQLEQLHNSKSVQQQPLFEPTRPSQAPQPAACSSTKLLPPEILKRIEDNRAAALTRLQQAAAAALLAHRPAPSVAPLRSSDTSDAESCSSQASIKSYFKPDSSNSCSVPREERAVAGRRRQRPLCDVNALAQPLSPRSSQQSASNAAACNFKPFAPSSSSQSQSRPLPCAACGTICSGGSCKNGCALEYPLHPPLREYQYDLVRRCVARNSLVILPTGLGKTFVAGRKN
jgi:hypothetical protein